MTPNHEIETLETKLRSVEATLKYLYDEATAGVVVLQMDGTQYVNPRAEQIMRLGPSDPAAAPDTSWKESWGFFRLDGSRVNVDETGGFRAMIKGEAVDDEELRIVSDTRPDGYVISVTARPFPQGSLSVFEDVGERRALEDELEHRVAELAKKKAENADLIERLRLALDEVSTPVLEVWKDVLVLPVIGIVDSQRSAVMSERLLAEVVRTRAHTVVIDVTGLEVLDTSTADRFAKIAKAIELLGARCLLSGISPAVAKTLVELGVRIGDGIEPYATLRHALEHVMEGRAPSLSAPKKNEVPS